jgi:hypothetical protein
MHKPFHTLLFLALTFFVLCLISLVFPEKGIFITEKIVVHYPTFNSLFLEEKEQKTDITNIIALADAEDNAIESTTDTLTTSEKDNTSPAVAKLVKVDTALRLITSIQYKNESKTAMANFFNSFANISNEDKEHSYTYIMAIHKLKEIRISDYLRLKLQGEFGGEGPGLISFMPVAPSVVNKISWS